MKLRKLVAPLALVLIISGCSFSGKSVAPIVEGPTSTTVYTVQSGDTLYSIARRYGIDPRAVARENGITNPNQLRVGQRLKLSVGSSSNSIETSSSPAKAASSSVSAAPVTTVKSSQNVPAKSETSAAKPASSSGSGIFVWPAQGQVIKSFGPNNKGVDIGGKEGDPVVAAADGKVIVVGNMTNLGNLVIVQHNSTYVTAYCHLKNIQVAQNNLVKKGQKIATIGKTDAEAPRVHFEIRKLGKPLNPVDMLPAK